MTEESIPLPKRPKEMRRVGFQLKLALHAVKERKDLGEYHVDYRTIAQRFGVKTETLRKYWHLHKRGLIDWGEPENESEIQITSQAEMEKLLRLATKHHRLLLREYEALIYAAEDETDGAKLAERTAALDKCVKKLGGVFGFRLIAEKGFSNVLEEIVARRLRTEKALQGKDKTVTADVRTEIVTMSDEDRALRALRGDLPPAVEQPPAQTNGN